MKFRNLIATAGLLVGAQFAATAPAAAVELIVNGGFEQSTSPTVTPTGWTNFGHSDGVISYAQFGTPAYEGNYYYDFGGYGNSLGPAGHGIEQTVATVAGSTYNLVFGLSSENLIGTSILDLFFNNTLAATYTQGIDGAGVFKKPFVTQSVSFLATSNFTTIRFVEGLGSNGGNGSNDPMIDGVSFQGAAAGAVPEPASWAMMIGGFGMIGAAMRRRSAALTA